MFESPSLITRIAVGKAVGLVFGLAGLLIWPLFQPDIGWMPRIGILLWYPTVGAMIGMFGVFTTHPVLNLPLPWWFRAPLVGAWMNFVLTFFAYDAMAAAAAALFGPESAFGSPFWFTLEGAIVGLVIGFAATKLGGEGRETVTRAAA